MPASREKERGGRVPDAQGNPGNGMPSVKEVIHDLAAALSEASLEDGNDALGKFVTLSLGEAEKSVLYETGSVNDSRVDEVADDAATQRAMTYYALLETVSTTDVEIEDPEEVAAWFVHTALDDIRGFRRKDGQRVPPRIWRPSARNKHQRDKSLDDPIAGKNAEKGDNSLGDICEDKKTHEPWQLSVLREELTQWWEVAETHPNRTLREILPEVLELWDGCDFGICPLDLYEMRPIEPPRIDKGLLAHMRESLADESIESLKERVREIRYFLARFDLIEPRGLAEELRARVNNLVAFAKQAPESVCGATPRETIKVVADYLLMILSKQDFQSRSAANVILPSLLLEYRCRVNPKVIDHLEERLGRSRDTLQKCLKRLREILLSDPSSVLRRSNPRETQ